MINKESFQEKKAAGLKEIQITKEISGGRLDKIVSRYLDKAPKGFVYKMLRKKNIVLNDHKASGNELLIEGDCIKFYLADETIEKFQSKKKQGIKETKTAKLFRNRNTGRADRF